MVFTTSLVWASPAVSDADVERVIVKTLEETPTDATHWSTRSMARTTGMSQSAVSRIWRAFGLKLHLVDEFKLSPTPSSSRTRGRAIERSQNARLHAVEEHP